MSLETTQLAGGGDVLQSSSHASLTSQPGPYPLPAYLKHVGAQIATVAAKDISGTSSSLNPRGIHSNYITPLLAAFTARCLTLEAEENAQSKGVESLYPIDSQFANGGGGVVSGGGSQSMVQTINLTKEQEAQLVGATLHRLHQLDDPLLETIKMQVAFESLYATEVQKKRTRNYQLDQENTAQLNKILEIGTNIQSNAQVASLYRAIFKLMLQNGCVDTTVPDRNVDREIAAALESVFPQAGLNSFNMMSAQEKKLQILNLINIVLGIRLFNRDIKKGGAGLVDVPGLASLEVENLYEEFEKESTTLGDICYTYSDVLQMEFYKPGTISASVSRLQNELLNRRQYILLIHQLQHEVLESLDLIKDAKLKFAELCSELKTLVGLRTSVPKEQVYPKFQALAMYWRNLVEEREMNTMRAHIFQNILLKFRQSFTSNLLEEDIELLKKFKKDPATIDREKAQYEAIHSNSAVFDEFVETIPLPTAGSAEEEKMNNGGSSVAAGANMASYRPVRLIKENTPTFMSLPLEYQGYCSWSIVHRGGLLLPGNPALGIIRVLGRHYSFTSIEAMQDFCEDPEKYIEGVLQSAKHNPCLIHLLCLQPYIPHSDISELFSLQYMMEEQASGGSVIQAQKMNAGCQTPHYINTTLPDPNYHWNEWDLRRAAIQMADLTKKKTVSQQTNLSHFRRDNCTQYTLPKLETDGSMEGKGTQTGVEKSSQVERVYKYHAGLRGKPASTSYLAANGSSGSTASNQLTSSQAVVTNLKDSNGEPKRDGANMRVVELRIPTHVEDATNSSLQLKPHESLKTYIVRDRKKEYASITG